ncbi:hypothetical protein OIV83_001321 [Microbotryomycetes sp. JL201]|nr:hypothetical protein OIV83_001321 [Microbotryomycetes sp. JL201]
MSQADSLAEREERLLAIVHALGHPTLDSLEHFIVEHGHVAVVQVQENIGDETQAQTQTNVSRDYEQRYRTLKAELATRSNQLATARAELKDQTLQIQELTRARDMLRKDLELVLDRPAEHWAKTPMTAVNSDRRQTPEREADNVTSHPNTALDNIGAQTSQRFQAQPDLFYRGSPDEAFQMPNAGSPMVGPSTTPVTTSKPNLSIGRVSPPNVPSQDHKEQIRLYQTCRDSYLASRRDLVRNQQYIDLKWTPYVQKNLHHFTAPPPAAPMIPGLREFPEPRQLDTSQISALYPALETAERQSVAVLSALRVWRTQVRVFYESQRIKVVLEPQQQEHSTPAQWSKKHRKKGTRASPFRPTALDTSNTTPPRSETSASKTDQPQEYAHDNLARDLEKSSRLTLERQQGAKHPGSPLQTLALAAVDANCPSDPQQQNQIEAPLGQDLPGKIDLRPDRSLIAQIAGSGIEASTACKESDSAVHDQHQLIGSAKCSEATQSAEFQFAQSSAASGCRRSRRANLPVERVTAIAPRENSGPETPVKNEHGSSPRSLKRSRSALAQIETPEVKRSVPLRHTVSASALAANEEYGLPDSLSTREIIARAKARRRIEAEAIRAARTPVKDTPKNPRVQDLSELSSRKKEVRQRMTGSSCEQCKSYYDATSHGESPRRVCSHSKSDQSFSPLNPLSRQAHVDHKERLQSTSRHRSFRQAEPDPPGYWDMHFPNTQQVAELNRQSEEQRHQMRENGQR